MTMSKKPSSLFGATAQVHANRPDPVVALIEAEQAGQTRGTNQDEQARAERGGAETWPAEQAGAAIPTPRKRRPRISRLASTRVDKRFLTVGVTEDVFYEFKRIALDERTTVQALHEEAIERFLASRRKRHSTINREAETGS